MVSQLPLRRSASEALARRRNEPLEWRSRTLSTSAATSFGSVSSISKLWPRSWSPMSAMIAGSSGSFPDGLNDPTSAWG